MNKIVRIGVLGVGKMGQNHLRNLVLLKNVEIVFCYDLDTIALQKCSKLHEIKASENLESDLKTVDAIIIVTPTFTHCDYIKLASRYVKYIFVEKPLTDKANTSLEMVQLSQEKGLYIQVGFIERYNSAINAMQKVLKQSKNVINIDFARTNKVSSRITDVDVVIDLMIHDIDLALLLNGRPKKISAHGYVKEGMIEYARAIITHENGTFSNLVASRITEKRIRHIAATCEDMYIDCNLLSKEVKVNKQSLEQYLENVSISSKEETIDVRPQEALLMELLDFVTLVRGGEVHAAMVEDGLAAMEVAHTIQTIILGNQ